MNSMIRRRLPALWLTLLLTAPAAAEDPYKDVRISTTQAADGIYMLQGQGGNIGVSVGKDGVLLVDDQFAPLTEKIRAAIGRLSDKPVRFVLNTHWHGDHTGGNENLGEGGSLIVAHDNVRKRLSVDGYIRQFDFRMPATKPVGLPVITFNDELTLHMNGEEIVVRHVGHAHTDGDVIVHFRTSNVIHTGDACFSGMYPFIDLDSGGSIDGYISAVNAVIDLADDSTVIIPGHGPILDRKALTAWRDMLVTIRERVLDGIREGRSLDDIRADWPTVEFDERYSGGRIGGETFVEFIYRDLAQGDG